jgi:hypothetical protein
MPPPKSIGCRHTCAVLGVTTRVTFAKHKQILGVAFELPSWYPPVTSQLLHSPHTVVGVAEHPLQRCFNLRSSLGYEVAVNAAWSHSYEQVTQTDSGGSR